ncbi:MAG: metallophosphoesterase [Syntrophotaleaceae bacterium]
MRVVHLSDLHLRSLPDHFTAAAATINELRPDLILLTGDYLDQARRLDGALDFLRLLQAEGGIFAVQGNWEYWARLEGDPLRRRLASVGVELLIDQRHDLLIRGIPLSILGIDYPSAHDSLSKIRQTAQPERLNIVLSHVPAFGHDTLGSLADLILSGHTHGGQVRLPWVPPFYLPRFSAPFVAGLYRVTANRIPLYVNRGMGTSVLPVRLFCQPEIALLQLHSPPAGELPWYQEQALFEPRTLDT